MQGAEDRTWGEEEVEECVRVSGSLGLLRRGSAHLTTSCSASFSRQIRDSEDSWVPGKDKLGPKETPT